MRRYQLAIEKASVLRQRFIEGNYHSYLLAKELHVSTVTTWRYQREFERIRAEYPDRLTDFGFYPGEPPRKPQAKKPTAKYQELQVILPVLAAEAQAPLEIKTVWRRYHALSDGKYCYQEFVRQFQDWWKAHVIPAPAPEPFKIRPADMRTLERWRRGNDHRRWQIAKSLMLLAAGVPRPEIVRLAESTPLSLSRWTATYLRKGLIGFEPAYTPNRKAMQAVKERKERLIKLMQEQPRAHGLNRASWNLTALTQVYNRLYPPGVNYPVVRLSVHQLGYRFRQSRQMLMSPDPHYREKIRKIQQILQRLKPDEKFFSIDEYGPVWVRIKGGRSLKAPGERGEVIPQQQKSKGSIICTAALELSTNQVTHLYSSKKNTFEMIRLIETLAEQYRGQRRLYLCWDAASWHNSKILKTYIEDHNKSCYPEIRLAPLPSCTQYLNVIESVFAGLAKAVIHNSNYENLEACQAAISQHFETRNQHFKAHPKRAGRKIWGQETVKAKFSETQNCRKRSAMRGAK